MKTEYERRYKYEFNQLIIGLTLLIILLGSLL
jgi:hypothetical protein